MSPLSLLLLSRPVMPTSIASPAAVLCSIGLTMPNYVFNEDRYFRGCLLAPTPMKEAVSHRGQWLSSSDFEGTASVIFPTKEPIKRRRRKLASIFYIIETPKSDQSMYIILIICIWSCQISKSSISSKNSNFEFEISGTSPGFHNKITEII